MTTSEKTLPRQQQEPPGSQEAMTPQPDSGEASYEGHGRLKGKRTLITGADSGIGRAVAIAYAREGADVVIGYLSEHEDAEKTKELVEEAGQTAVLVPGDLSDPQQCRELVTQTVQRLGGIDVLVSNAAYQMTHDSLGEITEEEWNHTIDANLSAFFHLSKAAIPHMKEGASIIATASIQGDQPSPALAAYATTKAAIPALAASLAASVGPQGIRVNTVAPGPIWTPLIPSTMPPEHVERFGANTPLGRPGQPVEVAPVYVLLASDESSYISGACIPVTGGRPIL